MLNEIRSEAQVMARLGEEIIIFPLCATDCFFPLFPSRQSSKYSVVHWGGDQESCRWRRESTQ